ncbi:tetratricopeptide (TPR) repeat protein [Sphingomonas jejuensis]|uniref:Tetratricopeptide (TPR) repeat protein n=1 Tax=Sphingomonas jejuensis TaxID=904715 RepID=A0ABX0XLX0_9SPHN|nr:hypothetical protein [Sphingomonas jejuensis]NJC33710.1 tetratricopeptide (TPR) repeat protein [Sphingomonas jejuensis]
MFKRSRRFITGSTRPVTAALLAGLLLAGCSSREERAMEAAATAEQAFQAGDLVTARRFALEAVSARDDLPQIWGLLGRIEVSAGDYSAAFNAYSRMNELDRTNQEALQLVMEISYLAGRYRDADRYADEMLSLNPANLRAQLLKAGVAFQNKQYDGALAGAERVLTTDPANEDARVLKARALDGKDEPEAAIAYLEGELKLRGNGRPSLEELRGLYTRVGDTAGLDRTFQRLLVVAGNDTNVIMSYAADLYRRGNDAAANRQAENLWANNREDGAVLQRIVDMWLRTGRDPVRPGWIAETAAAGTQAERHALARYTIERGRPAEALAMLEPIRGPDQISYANVESQVLIAAAEAALGRTADARARIERIHDFDPTNPRALTVRAELLAAAGELEPALIDAQILVRDNPTAWKPRVLLADIYARRRDVRLADSKYREGMRAIPDSADILDRYAAFLLANDRRREALRLAEGFTRDNPGDPRGWRARATLCRAAGDSACFADAQQAIREIVGEAGNG